MIKDQQLAAKDQQLAAKDQQLEMKEQLNVKLQEKVAVMTNGNKTKHVFQLYQHRDRSDMYIFIRAQHRYLRRAMKAVDSEEYDLILNEVDVPNSMNILNKLKEKLVDLHISYKAQRNKLTVADVNVLEMVEDMLQEPWV